MEFQNIFHNFLAYFYKLCLFKLFIQYWIKIAWYLNYLFNFYNSLFLRYNYQAKTTSQFQLIMQAKILQEVYDALSSNPTKLILGSQQTDDDFLDNVFAIAEHSETMKKQLFGPRSNLTEQQYQFVQRTGVIHYKCCMFNETNLMIPQDIPIQNKCKCGCGKAHGQALPYCMNQQQATFIGPGIILFFFYTKMMFLLILMLIIVFSIYSMTTNIMVANFHSDCEQPGALGFLCQLKIIVSLQSKDGRDDLLVGQLILGMVACFLWSLGVRIVRAIGRRKNRKIDDYLDSSADLCIMIRNLPQGDYSEPEILSFLKKKWQKQPKLNKHPLQIRGIQIVYKMQRVRNLIDKIYTLANQLIKLVIIKTGEENQYSKKYFIKQNQLQIYLHKKQQILLMHKRLKDFREKFWNDTQFRHWLSAGVAIVQFQHPGQQELFLEYYGTNKKTVLKENIKAFKARYFQKITQQFQGQTISIIKAPEPSDIFWDHCQQKVQTSKVILIWTINIILMGCSFGAQMIVRSYKLKHPDISQLGIISIVTLNLFNRFIWNVLLSIIFLEKNHTKTDNIISAMNKSYVSQVMNIILIPIILNLVLADKLDGPNGLAGAIHDYQITAFFFMMVFNFINFPDLIMRVLRCIKPIRRAIIRFYCRVTGQLDTFDEMRQALNFVYTPPNVPIAGFYVYITTVISQAAFFCHLQPIIICYLLCSTVLFHLINRYIVLKRCKIPDLIDFVVFETCCGFAMNVPLLYAIGTILFLQLRDAPHFGYYVPSIICIFIWMFSTINFFGIYQKLIRCIINKFYTVEKQQEQHNQQIGKNLITSIFKKMKQQDSKKKKKRQVTKRKQNYHSNCTTTLIFNMQNQLQEVVGRYHNKSREFCHRFTLNMGEDTDFTHQGYHKQISIEKHLEDSTSHIINPKDRVNDEMSVTNHHNLKTGSDRNISNRKMVLTTQNNHTDEQQFKQQSNGVNVNIFEKHSNVFGQIFGGSDGKLKEKQHFLEQKNKKIKKIQDE